jgi:hypothetical protein
VRTAGGADADGAKGGRTMRATSSGLKLALVLLAAGLVAPNSASAQAWLPPKGEASFSLGYQYYASKDRVSTSTGDRDYDGQIHQHGIVGLLTYGITGRLAASLGVPPYYISSYRGPDPHTWPVFDGESIAKDSSGQPLFYQPTIDDGSYHGSFQDFRAELSFMALQEPLVVTPFVGFGVPSHTYEYNAQTAVGRRLWEMRFGVNVARRLDPILPDAYLHGRYAFAYRQATEGLRFNYSFVDVEAGYFVSPSLSLRIMLSGQIGHDGLRDEEYTFTPPWPEGYTISQWLYISSEGQQMRGQPALPVALRHDQLQLQTTLELGAGASFSVTPSLSVSAQVLRSVYGRGGRATDLSIGLWTTLTVVPSKLSGNPAPRAARRPVPSLE